MHQIQYIASPGLRRGLDRQVATAPLLEPFAQARGWLARTPAQSASRRFRRKRRSRHRRASAIAAQRAADIAAQAPSPRSAQPDIAAQAPQPTSPRSAAADLAPRSAQPTSPRKRRGRHRRRSAAADFAAEAGCVTRQPLGIPRAHLVKRAPGMRAMARTRGPPPGGGFRRRHCARAWLMSGR